MGDQRESAGRLADLRSRHVAPTGPTAERRCARGGLSGARTAAGEVRTDHVEQLAELQLEADDERVAVVIDGSDEFVVVGQQVLEQAIRIAIRLRHSVHRHRPRYHKHLSRQHSAPSTAIHHLGSVENVSLEASSH